jgi:hypothetical protein
MFYMQARNFFRNAAVGMKCKFFSAVPIKGLVGADQQ